MIWLILYIALLLGIGFHHWLQHRGTSLDGFVVYDRRASGFSVGMSLVALAFGASSVFGLAGYAYQYNSLFDDFWFEGRETPCEVARRPFGRIAIANADAGAYSYTDAAIDHAHRAVQELLRLG